jgi:putative transposase
MGNRSRRWTVGKPSVLIPNLLQRQFTATRPNTAWVTEITTSGRVAALALFCRRHGSVLAPDQSGWAAEPAIHRELVLNAVLLAVR